MRGGLTPSSALHPSGGCAPTTPMGRALRPSTPGDFPVAGKVTKGAPRAAPFGIPRCVVAALFALAYASRRDGFCHRKRPICHFEVVGKPVFVVSFGFDQEKYSAVNPWRGRRLVARLDATFGGIRGIGEGVLRRRAGVLCSSVPVLCRFCAATNGLITPFIGQLQRKHSIFIKRYFKIVYRKRVRKVLCFRCFRCRGLLKIPPPLVNLLALIV